MSDFPKEVLSVGIAIGATSCAVGRFRAVSSREALVGRAYAGVDLHPLEYSRPVQSSSLRASSDDPTEWKAETWRDSAETMTVPHAQLVGSPVLYFGRTERNLTWNNAALDDVVPLDPGKMYAALLARIMRRVRSDQPEDVVREVVLTAPLNHGEAWLDIVKTACTIAGVELAALLPEPAAILTHYAFAALMSWSVDERILLLDWGGGSLKLTLVQYQGRGADGDRFHVVVALVLPEAGGMVIDRRIAWDIVRQFGSVPRLGQNFERIPRLLGMAVEMKAAVANRLNDEPEARYLEDKTVTLDRSDLLRLLRGDPDRREPDILERMKLALHDLRDLDGGIDRVLLAGGCGGMSQAADALRRVLGPDIEIVAYGENDHGSLEQVAARGATVYAAQLRDQPGAGTPIVLNVPSLLAHDIMIRQQGGASAPLLRAGMPSDPPLRSARELTIVDNDMVVLECVQHSASGSSRRLAGVNLGHVAPGTRVTCQFEMTDRGTGDLTIRWADGIVGPIPISLESGPGS